MALAAAICQSSAGRGEWVLGPMKLPIAYGASGGFALMASESLACRHEEWRMAGHGRVN